MNRLPLCQIPDCLLTWINTHSLHVKNNNSILKLVGTGGYGVGCV